MLAGFFLGFFDTCGTIPRSKNKNDRPAVTRIAATIPRGFFDPGGPGGFAGFFLEEVFFTTFFFFFGCGIDVVYVVPMELTNAL